MPLPPALLARLQKRGIVSDVNQKLENPQECEEVIAEDYDEPSSKTNLFGKKSKVPVTGCPNKYNIYHECSDFCQKRWGFGKENPSPTLRRKYQRVLKKYPLPADWQQVWDPGVACFYFWNTVNDEVSWLPPSHPKAAISVSANKLRAMVKEDENVSDDSEEDNKSSDDMGNDSESSITSSSESDSEGDMEKEEPKKRGFHSSKKNVQYSSFQDKNMKGRQRLKNNDLDPMDPASYSDSCPRGKWSDGLEKQGEAKSGVDPTASGPLFQMRPYPSPGSVLRMNKNS